MVAASRPPAAGAGAAGDPGGPGRAARPQNLSEVMARHPSLAPTAVAAMEAMSHQAKAASSPQLQVVRAGTSIAAPAVENNRTMSSKAFAAAAGMSMAGKQAKQLQAEAIKRAQLEEEGVDDAACDDGCAFGLGFELDNTPRKSIQCPYYTSDSMYSDPLVDGPPCLAATEELSPPSCKKPDANETVVG